MKNALKHGIFTIIMIGLVCSFWLSKSWLALCVGLAFFLFGMQCMEDGLQKLAGGKLEQLLAKNTATPSKGLLFGIGATIVLQSTTLVSLLTIAFISTGLISLAGGISIILGTNLGATGGIWLLALAGQSISLSKFAYPLIVLGVLASFNNDKSKAIGRIFIGIAFIFLGIDQIKEGFSSFTQGFDFAQYQFTGLAGVFIFLAIGLLITVVLQSSHATLMLTLTALGLGQINLVQSFAIAIGANVGSAVTTGVMGLLGGNRSGQRLALAHVIFNVATGLLTFILLAPLTWLVVFIASVTGFNSLIQLALFHTIFNGTGVIIFWFLQGKLARVLEKCLPDAEEPTVLITEVATPVEAQDIDEVAVARYLDENALSSVETAISAVIQELEHLGRLCVEVICHALYLPIAQLNADQMDMALIKKAPDVMGLDADALYRHYIKGIYGDLLTFMGRIEIVSDDDAHQQRFITCQVVALQLVDAVNDAKHLQKNLKYYLAQQDLVARTFYVELRKYVLANLREIIQIRLLELPDELWVSRVKLLNENSAEFDQHFRHRLFIAVREHNLTGQQTSSLMNDIGYASRIVQSLRNVLLLVRSNDDDLYNAFKKVVENNAEDTTIVTL